MPPKEDEDASWEVRGINDLVGVKMSGGGPAARVIFMWACPCTEEKKKEKRFL